MRFVHAIALVLLMRPALTRAQVARDSAVDWLVSAGSEGERYLRALQVAGLAPITQWSIRPISPRALRRMTPADSGHPWKREFHRLPSGTRVRVVQPQVGVIFNTTYPYGLNDGSLWAGRGITVGASVGITGEFGPFDFTVAPEVFEAQNVGFPLAPNGRTGPQRFGDPMLATYIDLPQRFGAGRYGKFTAGSSELALVIVGVRGGISSANEYWGPAADSPYLLGNNAGGFPHVFLGTDGTQSIGPLRVGVRLIAGTLEQSSYSSATFANRRRSLAGAIGVIGVSYVPGLELGAARLFEDNYPDSGVTIGDILRPLAHGLLKQQRARALGNATGDEPDNQLASLFARWVLPRSGVEVYGEIGRDDNSYDERDLLLEPDHDLTYILGFGRVWRRSESLVSLRGEIVDSRITHLVRVRAQATPYYHTTVLQGHTQAGQLMGAPMVFGGGGSVVTFESLTTSGRRTLTWRRYLREPQAVSAAPADVLNAFTAQWLMFRHRIDLMPEATAVLNLDRDGVGDKFNLRLALTASAHW